MTDFFNSKFMQDLQDGKLPPVDVQIPGKIFVYQGLTMVLSGLLIIIAFTYLKK